MNGIWIWGVVCFQNIEWYGYVGMIYNWFVDFVINMNYYVVYFCMCFDKNYFQYCEVLDILKDLILEL